MLTVAGEESVLRGKGIDGSTDRSDSRVGAEEDQSSRSMGGGCDPDEEAVTGIGVVDSFAVDSFVLIERGVRSGFSGLRGLADMVRDERRRVK